MKLSNGIKLNLSFIILISFILFMSSLSIFSITKISDKFSELYNKPLMVRSYILKANTSLVALHRAMKDVALSTDKTHIQAAIKDVGKYYNEFVLYINKASSINIDAKSRNSIGKIIKAFNDWTFIRNRVITLTNEGNNGAAAEITKGAGAKQVNLIETELRRLINAIEKQVKGNYESLQEQNTKIIGTIILFTLVVVILSIFIVILVSRSQKNFKLTLFEEKEYFRITINSIGDGVIVTDTNGKITLLNPIAEKLTGWKQNDALGKMFLQVFNVSHEDPSQTVKNPIEEVLSTRNICELSNHAVLTSLDGEKRNVSDSAAPIKNKNGEMTGVVMVFRDVTERRHYIDEVKYLSFHDKLTGLYNRAFLEEELQRMDSSQYLPVSLIIGDINGLKLTNDVFGHSAGDELLKSAADIMRKSCRPGDIVARWGGDEFVLCLPQTPENDARNICERINELCKNTNLDFKNENIFPSISLGLAIKTSENENINQVLKTAENNMYQKKLLDSKSVHSSIINSMKSTLFEKSHETQEHADRLIDLCNKIGLKLKLAANVLNELELFAMLHDIGKIAIDKNILLKPGKLSAPEWEEMKRHPEVGYRIARASIELSGISDYILSHHERWDGNGYPQGLSGSDIPLLSRILAVVDSFDAMTNDRPYRKGIRIEEAREELKRNSGTQFDPEIVAIILELI